MRRAAGLSQQQLAARADCSIGMVRLVESGYRPEPSAVLERIIAVLHDERPVHQPGAVTTSAGQGQRDEA